MDNPRSSSRLWVPDAITSVVPAAVDGNTLIGQEDEGVDDLGSVIQPQGDTAVLFGGPPRVLGLVIFAGADPWAGLGVASVPGLQHSLA